MSGKYLLFCKGQDININVIYSYSNLEIMSLAMSIAYRAALLIAALLVIAGSYAATNTKYR